MGLVRLFVILLATSAINSAWCHHHHHGVHADGKKKRDQVDHATRYDANAISTPETEKNRCLNMDEAKDTVPFSTRRLEKMLEKALLKIITGDLNTADMLLLKSLNCSLEEVLALRERELQKKKDEELRRKESVKSWSKVLYGEPGEKWNRYLEKNSMDHSSKSPDFETTKRQGKKNRRTEKTSHKDNFDYEAYNRQAVLDYENLPSNLEFQQPWSESTALDYEDTEKATKEEESGNNLHRDFDKAMEPYVVFKIRYDDSEFDSSSGSDEIGKGRSKTSNHHVASSLRHTTPRNTGNSFHSSSTPPSVSSSPVPLPVAYQLGSSNNVKASYSKSHVHPSTAMSSTSSSSTTTEVSKPDETVATEEKANEIVQTTSSIDEIIARNGEKPSENRTVSKYDGLEWIEDDVYRVRPEFLGSIDYENNQENETSDYAEHGHEWNTEENENDTLEYQNDTPDSVKLFVANSNISSSLPLANLSIYQQAALAHRRGGNVTSSFDSQGEKAIEDIKSRILVLTGRMNSTSNTNQVQREKLTMFSPTCQTPRNTDQDAWTDPFSMNMYFQLNLTSGDHVVAAKLRIYKLPQENLTSSVVTTFEEDVEDEKKIRISVYYYTKSLKKHRSKKRLMDSVVTPLTSDGTHLVLDVRQGLRFWRLNPRNSHGNGNNHGLVIQVEDQDGRPLKPALYIQQPSCADQGSEQKAYQRVPALFVRACARYVRIVNGETVTYVNCRH